MLWVRCDSCDFALTPLLQVLIFEMQNQAREEMQRLVESLLTLEDKHLSQVCLHDLLYVLYVLIAAWHLTLACTAFFTSPLTSLMLPQDLMHHLKDAQSSQVITKRPALPMQSLRTCIRAAEFHIL